MSNNNMFNAILAYVEGRIDQARTYIRSGEFADSDVTVTDLYVRLEAALDKARAAKSVELCRTILRSSLQVQPDDPLTKQEREAFFLGVAAVERLIESELSQLEQTK